MIFVENTKEEVNIAEMYGEECTLPKEKFIKKYKVKENGLTSKEADNLIKNIGLNEVKQA